MRRICLLGTGLIGGFYTESLHGQRSRDQVTVAYSRSAERAQAFAAKWNIPRSCTNLRDAVEGSDSDVVIVALPNHLHEEAVLAAAAAGKAVLCTKPLGRTADEALRMLQACEQAGVFHGYLEDLCYTPKTLKALAAVRKGALGKVLWVRSREMPLGAAQRRGSGTWPSRGAGRLSISVATASRSPAILSARKCGRSK